MGIAIKKVEARSRGTAQTDCSQVKFPRSGAFHARSLGPDTAPDGSESGTSRRATPIRLSAIP